MTNDVGQMITSGTKGERSVIECIGQTLDGPIEIGSRRVRKQKMPKPFGDQTPASDERIAQDQSGVVPDETVSQRRRVGGEDDGDDSESRKDFLHRRNWVGQKQ
jgi:hypothetical protein